MFGAAMRNLMLLLIVFIAVVTFIRAFDKAEAGTLNEPPVQTTIERTHGN